MSLRIGFFGSAPFVVEFLDVIFNSKHKLEFIVTSPDRPKGRGKQLLPTTTKEFAIKRGIPYFQPENLKNDDFLNNIKKFSVDIFLVIAYGKKLQSELLFYPPLHSFNLHFSLLPRWRGAAPVNWAILAGDKQTGLTFMKMDEGIDTGDILTQQVLEINENETAEELFKRIIDVGKPFLIHSLEIIENRNFILTKQDESLATYASIFKKDDGLIDWNKTAIEIHNKIRGMLPWPSAFTFYRGKRLKLLKSKIVIDSGPIGCIFKSDKEGFFVGTGNQSVMIIEVQEEGKNKVNAADFLRGKPNSLNSYFDGYGEL